MWGAATKHAMMSKGMEEWRNGFAYLFSVISATIIAEADAVAL